MECGGNGTLLVLGLNLEKTSTLLWGSPYLPCKKSGYATKKTTHTQSGHVKLKNERDLAVQLWL
jgi:hypothetical protein